MNSEEQLVRAVAAKLKEWAEKPSGKAGVPASYEVQVEPIRRLAQGQGPTVEAEVHEACLAVARVMVQMSKGAGIHPDELKRRMGIV